MRLAEEIERRVAEQMAQREIKCPSCGYRFDQDDMEGLVTMWGENPPVETECPSCAVELTIQEEVIRKYEVAVRKERVMSKSDELRLQAEIISEQKAEIEQLRGIIFRNCQDPRDGVGPGDEDIIRAIHQEFEPYCDCGDCLSTRSQKGWRP